MLGQLYIMAQCDILDKQYIENELIFEVKIFLILILLIMILFGYNKVEKIYGDKIYIIFIISIL